MLKTWVIGGVMLHLGLMCWLSGRHFTAAVSLMHQLASIVTSSLERGVLLPGPDRCKR